MKGAKTLSRQDIVAKFFETISSRLKEAFVRGITSQNLCIPYICYCAPKYLERVEVNLEIIKSTVWNASIYNADKLLRENAPNPHFLLDREERGLAGQSPQESFKNHALFFV